MVNWMPSAGTEPALVTVVGLDFHSDPICLPGLLLAALASTLTGHRLAPRR